MTPLLASIIDALNDPRNDPRNTTVANRMEAERLIVEAFDGEPPPVGFIDGLNKLKMPWAAGEVDTSHSPEDAFGLGWDAAIEAVKELCKIPA